eukprot:363428-Chlamydomonas_euryale.AAC.5
MPDESVVKQLLFAEKLVGLGGLFGRPRAPRGGIGPWQQLCAWFSWPGWGCVVGMGWLRTVHSGVPFVTASSLLFDPRCIAALNTGKPFVGPLPVTLTLTLTLCDSFSDLDADSDPV